MFPCHCQHPHPLVEVQVVKKALVKNENDIMFQFFYTPGSKAWLTKQRYITYFLKKMASFSTGK